MPSSNGNIFRVTDPLWRESTGHRWVPLIKPVTRSFDVLFDLRLNKRLSKQSRRRWFETPLRPLWYHCNDNTDCQSIHYNTRFNMITGDGLVPIMLYAICNNKVVSGIHLLWNISCFYSSHTWTIKLIMCEDLSKTCQRGSMSWPMNNWIGLAYPYLIYHMDT